MPGVGLITHLEIFSRQDIIDAGKTIRVVNAASMLHDRGCLPVISTGMAELISR